jgi:hypothetical protein
MNVDPAFESYLDSCVGELACGIVSDADVIVMV